MTSIETFSQNLIVGDIFFSRITWNTVFVWVLIDFISFIFLDETLGSEIVDQRLVCLPQRCVEIHLEHMG